MTVREYIQLLLTCDQSATVFTFNREEGREEASGPSEEKWDILHDKSIRITFGDLIMKTVKGVVLR